MSSLNRGKIQPGGGHGGGGLPNQPRGGPSAAAALGKSSAPLPSSQYLDAINTLCEATMAEACALCLSEADYSDSNNNNSNSNHNGNGDEKNKSDYKKLLEIEQKCRDAVKVVHKEAVSAPPPSNTNTTMLPPSIPTIPASRVNPAAAAGKKVATATKGNNPTAKALVGKTVPPNASKTGAMPIRRGSLVSGRDRPAGMHNKRSMVQPLQRADSDESSSSNTSGANKKPRLGGPPPPPGLAPMSGNKNHNTATSASNEGTGGGGDAPPPSALDFLKKLNQDKASAAPHQEGSNKQLTKADSKGKKDKEKDKDEGDNVSEADSTTSDNSRSSRRKKSVSPTNNTSMPAREGVRKNPTRGARR